MGKAKKVDKEPMKRFNWLLDTLKNEYQITQKRLAKQMNVTEQTITGYKKGNNNIPGPEAPNICKAVKTLTKNKSNGVLDISPQWLLGLDDFRNEKERLEWNIKNDQEKKKREEQRKEIIDRIMASNESKEKAIRNIYELLKYMGYEIESAYIMNWQEMLNALQNAPGKEKYLTDHINRYNSLQAWIEGEQLTRDDIVRALNYIGDMYSGVMYCISTPSGATKVICRDDFLAMIIAIKNTAAALIESGIERTGRHCFLDTVISDNIPIAPPSYPNMI